MSENWLNEMQNDKQKALRLTRGFKQAATVIPQKRQCKFETLYPAASSVEAAITPSRWDVVCHIAEVRTLNE